MGSLAQSCRGTSEESGSETVLGLCALSIELLCLTGYREVAGRSDRVTDKVVL